jgi:hypothetical protein
MASRGGSPHPGSIADPRDVALGFQCYADRLTEVEARLVALRFGLKPAGKAGYAPKARSNQRLAREFHTTGLIVTVALRTAIAKLGVELKSCKTVPSEDTLARAVALVAPASVVTDTGL